MLAVIILMMILNLFAIVSLLYLLLFVRPGKKWKKEHDGLLCEYAHRGLHGNGVPENSLAAFSLACESGFGIELDVQLSSDGEVMVFHDATLVRMTGCEKKLCELSAEELQSLRLKDTDETIPTFRQVLKLVGGRVPLLIELKGESTKVDLCPKVASLLKDYEGPFCMESFNPLLVRGIRKCLPGIPCGQLYTNLCRDQKKRSLRNILLTSMALNFLARPHFIAYNQLDRNSFPVRLATEFYSAPKFVWTVRSEEELTRARSLEECAIFEKSLDIPSGT